ncbi:apoptosis facilitator Bcl-2-like protein 14 [Thalassophryne amazonica]|uniref:apoptosis facilitator Bcl-2-like protein 14 n=1 Tax=Thalassophryne amazonica TaxID=390379 RepID=UPI001470A7B7|nr:apoptosis facilitator Bcl-2-like protein 14 [Thalassophryne amazonica]XP_034019060.1 apoptosis facilitator Bcl-2-like protein 14 [Thalassophryne amazonica]XP_034019061.1 apoptosis facilitator Bcl-2-like protein 14 [Thalassophryne amazonica]
MANGHVDICDPASNHNANGHIVPKPASSMEDTVEYTLLMVYATRRQPNKDTDTPAQNQIPASLAASDASFNQMPVKTEQKKKRKKWRGFTFTCLRSQTDDALSEAASKHDQNRPSEAGFRSGPLEFTSESGGDVRGAHRDDGSENDKLEVAVSRLTEIADQIPFTPPEIEADSEYVPEDDNIEKLIGLLLRESGDEFNRKVLRDSSLTAELRGNYSFFERLVSAFLEKMGIATSDPNSLGPQASPKTKLAITCEVSSRLSAVDQQLTRPLLGFGARYIQHNFSAWATQHGGYEDALNEDDDDNVE